jgi:hypothetical protein
VLFYAIPRIPVLPQKQRPAKREHGQAVDEINTKGNI